MSVYFVTGATGAVGSALVPLLLEDPATEVRLLIRAGTDIELQSRLDALFAYWDLGAVSAETCRRVTALRGDAVAERFGLDESAYDRLAGDVTHVVHAAGNVRMNLPLEQARRSAVDSVRQIAELARRCMENGRLQKVEVVSTVGVGGLLPVVPEDWIPTPRGFHNTYEAAKAEAERFLRGEIDAGLPVTLHRPSMVVGDSRTGRIIHFQIFYHLCEFLSGRRTLGLFPPLDGARLDTVPVDYVARVIAWSSREPSTVGRVLHECAGPTQAIGLPELRDLVRKRFRAAGVWVPPRLTLPALVFAGLGRALEHLVSEKARRALRTLPVFLEYLAANPEFENRRTSPMTASAGITVPTPADYLPAVLGYYFEHR